MMDFRNLDLDINPLLPPPQEVEAVLGYTPGSIPPYFSQLIEEALAQAKRLCTPQGGYGVLKLAIESCSDNSIQIGDKIFSCGKNIGPRLRTAEAAAVFVCTIGSVFSTYIETLSRQDEITLAYIADTVASETVERIAVALHDTASGEAALRDWGISERFSPGYCFWPVSDQRILFSLLPEGIFGIELNEGSMMRPEKSISGVFGLGPAMGMEAYRCSSCTNINCPMRRLPKRGALREKIVNVS